MSRHAIAVINTSSTTWAWRVGLQGTSGNVAGTGTVARFNTPIGMAHLDGTSIIVVNDYTNKRIARVDMSTLVVTSLRTNIQVDPITIAPGNVFCVHVVCLHQNIDHE